MRYPFDKYRLGTRYGAKGRFWKAGWHSGQDFISISFGGDGLVYAVPRDVEPNARYNAVLGSLLDMTCAVGFGVDFQILAAADIPR